MAEYLIDQSHAMHFTGFHNLPCFRFRAIDLINELSQGMNIAQIKITIRLYQGTVDLVFLKSAASYMKTH